MMRQAPIGGPDAVGEQAAEIAAAATAVPGVAALTGGAFGTVATYLPGARILGVAHDGAAWEIAVVAELGYDLPAIADRIRNAARAFTELPVDVTIADLKLEPHAADEPTSAEDESDRS